MVFLCVCVERCQRFGSFSQKSPPSFFRVPSGKTKGTGELRARAHATQKHAHDSLMDGYICRSTHTQTQTNEKIDKCDEKFCFVI
jgi:hypothetical protein